LKWILNGSLSRAGFRFENLGAHLGFRYFFSDGFGLFAEAGVPIAKYDKSVIGFERLNNQFALNFGALIYEIPLKHKKRQF
jgi:hypothetical protein